MVKTMMKRWFAICVVGMMALTGCDSIMPTKEDVDAWHARVVKEVPLALDMIEYGCTDRSEFIIAHLLEWGVPAGVIGRVSTFYEISKHPETGAFAFEDPLHDDTFQAAWNEAFGQDTPKVLRLVQGDLSYDLNVSGQIQWGIGHIAPTITVQDGTRWVIDPVLSPEKPLTLEEWRAAQNAPEAALVWGRVGKKPALVDKTMSPKETAEMLAIEEDAVWHPRHWAGYSFVGPQEDAAGNKLKDWSEATPDEQHMLRNRAAEKLAPLRAYQQLREQYSSASAFVQDLKKQQAEDDVITLRLERINQ